MEKKSPSEGAGFLSRLFFCWTVPLLRLGNQRALTAEDFHGVRPEDSSARLGAELSKNWNLELQRSRKSVNSCNRPSLMRAIVKTFGLRFGLAVLAAIMQKVVIQQGACITMGYVLRYFNGEYSDQFGWTMAALLLSLNSISSLINQPVFFQIVTVGMQSRVAISTLIFRKALRLSHASLRISSAAHRINLLSNDVNRFQMNMVHIQYLFIAPALLFSAPWILWPKIGPSSLVGVAILVVLVPLQGLASRIFGKMRTRIGALTDARIGVVSQVLNGLLLIKMAAWEIPFIELIAKARRAEMNLILKKGCLMGLNFSLFHSSSKCIILLTFLVYILTGNSMTAEKVFVTTAIYSIVGLCVAQFFPLAVAGLSEIMASSKRIEAMLLLEERNESAAILEAGIVNPGFELEELGPRTTEVQLEIRDLISKWAPEDEKLALDKISLSAKPGQLIAVTGTSGSGKSSLLQAILKELPAEEGSVVVEGRVAYVTQDPWLFPGSIRDNILMGREFEEDWYKFVTEACALTGDFKILPYEDKTIVGDNGIRLSGGQKARVNLARAVYADADIYLLDDPLSAVDARVGRHLMEQCIRGILKSKIVVLVTHQLHHLHKATEILQMSKGHIADRGTYDQLSAHRGFLAQENCNGMQTDGLEVNETWEIVDLGSGDARNSQLSESSEFMESKREQPTEPETDRSGMVGVRMYWRYLRSGNSIFWVLTFLFATVLKESLMRLADYWLKIWTENVQVLADTDTPNNVENNMPYIYVYCGIFGALFVASVIALQLHFRILASSSVDLHHYLSTAIVRAPMSFFSSNSMGRILNRFSNDMGTVDEGLPVFSYIVLTTMLEALGVLVLVVTTRAFMIIPSVVLIAFAVLLTRFYLRCSVSVKRIEAACRSHVLGEIRTCAQGLTTIRAFNAEATFEAQFMAALDRHSSVFYVFLASSRWFCLTIEWMCNFYYAGLVLALFLTDAGSAQAGLALTVGLNLSSIMYYCLSLLAELENEMVSAERIIDYSNIEPEGQFSIPGMKPSDTWPNAGKIQVSGLALQYGKDKPFLRDVKFSIRPMEKIGIVGRTGSGKSTLVRALFRIVEPCSGVIQIDEVNILKIGLHDLRSKISIIPQSPVLFTGSIRLNLDPFNQFSDDKLWSALDQVHLRNRITLNSEAGLETMVTEGGSNFSQGEIQLLCMARAILSNNKILVLDEATANIDSATDAIIQQTIRESFANCTVITVAHRLDTVMDSDRICVMDTGAIVEFDRPYKLLQNKNGYLHQLVQQTGRNGVEILTEMALKKERAREVHEASNY